MSKGKYQPLVGKDQQLLISLTICSTFHSVLWNWKQIWQKAVIWFSCNSIIYHEKYSFINNYLFWNDSSCHFGVRSSPQWGIFLSLSVIKSCSVQCVWNLVWMHFTTCLCFVMCIISFFALQTWNPILPDVEISLFWAAPLDTTLWLSGGIPPHKIPPFLFCSHESVTTHVTRNKQLQLESLQDWPKGPCKHCLLDLAKSILKHFLSSLSCYHSVKTRQHQPNREDSHKLPTSGRTLTLPAWLVFVCLRTTESGILETGSLTALSLRWCLFRNNKSIVLQMKNE